MGYKIDYELTAKVELINEFSHGVYNRFLNYILNNDYKGNSYYDALLKSFKEMLSVDLEFLDAEELEKVVSYWKVMDQYIKQII
ncbi:hypothetical protein IGI39_004921 [Enterococcus sp. AZ135]|uniref:hypothetical protein n=1 Tax=unclassified Enterococcus TaxID=2608891 RepID=UPI003F2620F2